MKTLSKIAICLLLASSSALATINLNTASKEELMSLDGIGDKNYEKIKGNIATSGENKLDKSKTKQTKEKTSKKIDENVDKKTKDTKDKAKKVKEQSKESMQKVGKEVR